MRFFCLGCLVLAGCGSVAADANMRDLRARLDTAEHARLETARKVEELDNRVFLLTDQVESQKVALSQKSGEPRLPVITLSPHSPRSESDAAGAQSESLDEQPLDPPVTISAGGGAGERPRRRVTLEGGATPWLGDGGDGGSGISMPGAARRAKRPSTMSTTSTVLASSTSGAMGAGLGKPSHPEHTERPAPVEPGDDGEPTALYRAAYGRLKAGQPEQAADELRAFVSRFPRHDLADNAQYWLGETFYARAAYREAIPEFRAVVRRWPTGNKAPDALLKLGYCHLALGEGTDGKQVLSEVADHYPRTEAALLASKRLAELAAEKKN